MRMCSRPALAAALTVATIGLAVGGCTPSTGSAQSSGTTKTLTVWHYFSVPGQTAGLDTLAKDFSSTHPGVQVTNVYVPIDQLTNKLVQAAGTKSGPDVVLFNASDTYTLKQAGAIPSMDWWDSYPDKGQFPTAVIQRLDGKVYGVQGFVNLLALWYNADLLKDLGVKPPSTMAELEQAMALAKTKGKGGITLTGKSAGGGEWQAFPWLSANGWSYKDPQQGPLTKTFSMVQEWANQGYLPKEASTWDQTIPFQQWEAGNTAFAENGNWQIASAKENAKFNYGVVPLPVGTAGGVYLGGEALNVGAFSKNPDLAREYLQQEYLTSKGELTLLDAFGAIPARADVAKSSKISDDPVLSVFAKVVADNGHTSPDPAIPPANVAKVLQTVGESWSSAIAGNATPDAISSQLMQQLTPMLGSR